MARQLVLCIDGTNNRFSNRPTNIVRIRRLLPNACSDVLPYYDQGVGTFGLKETLFEWQKVPARVAGLAFGWGLKQNVGNAYRFLVENYQDGDEIFLFGFSRGAYAVRALAALVAAAGLLARHEAHLFDHAWSLLVTRETQHTESEGPDFSLMHAFRDTFGRRVPIRFLGLFDTVKAVGWIYDPVVIPYTTNNPIVQSVRHAVSIDERRCFFRQHLWGNKPGPDVKEVWFPGVHSDIGGGYAANDADLALIALRWMLGEAAHAGLRLSWERVPEAFAPLPADELSATAPMHDSMTSAWKVAEWVPRRIWNGIDQHREWAIGAMPPFGAPRPRTVPPNVCLHRSVQTRLKGLPDYRPANLRGLEVPYCIADDLPLPGDIPHLLEVCDIPSDVPGDIPRDIPSGDGTERVNDRVTSDS